MPEFIDSPGPQMMASHKQFEAEPQFVDEPAPKAPGLASRTATRIKQGAMDPLYSEAQQMGQAITATAQNDTLKNNLLRYASSLDPVGIKGALTGLSRVVNLIPGMKEETQALSQQIQNTVNERERQYQQELGQPESLGGAMVRGLANPMNYLGGVAPLRGGAKKVVGALAQRAAMASAGAGAEPVAAQTPDEAMKQEALRRGMGAAMGATVAPVIEKGAEKLLIEPGVKFVGKLYNTIKNMRKPVEEGAYAPAATQFLKDAELLGIDEFTAGQALGKGKTVGVEAGLRDIPLLGDKAKLRAGLEQLSNKAKMIDERLRTEMQRAGYGSQDEVVAAAARGDRNASRLVGRMSEASEDANRIMQASLDNAGALKRKEVGKLYDDLELMLRGTGEVDLAFPKQYLRDIIDTQQASMAPNDNILREASALLRRLDDPKVPKDWTNIRRAVSDLGDKAKSLGRGSDPDFAASAVFGDIREVFRHSMDEHVVNTGNKQAIDALNEANKAYASRVAPYKARDVKTLIDSAEPDKAMRTIINTPGLSDRATRIYGMMDPKGRAAFRYALFHDSLEKATTGDMFSPAKLATELEKRMAEISGTFKGPDLQEMQALANVMRHMENTRLGDAVLNNGAKAVKWIMPGAAAGAVATGGTGTLPAIAGFGLLAKYLTQGPGKKFLLASSKLPPGSPQMERLMSQAISKMPRIASQELTIQNQEE